MHVISQPTLDRRDLMRGAAALPLAAVLANPMAAKAAADTLETVTLTTPSGREVSAALATPAATPAPAVLLIHEWWGLNDQIKAVAAEFAKQGQMALAVDLYDGKLAETGDRDTARSYMSAVKPEEATETLTSWIDWLRANKESTDKVATCGWCFGGGWSLNASIATPVEATVVYYGNVDKTAEQVAPLVGPVLGHFATEDQWINKDMVGRFEKAMAEAGHTPEVHWYEAQHGFANPTTERYDSEDAALAWSRTTAFLEKHLG